MLKKYYKYISVNLLALAGYAAAFPWWHIFFIQRPESVRNDAINHSMETVGLGLEIVFLYTICLKCLAILVIMFFIEKYFRGNKKCTLITIGEKIHFGFVTAGIVLFGIPIIPLTLLFSVFMLFALIESLY